MATRQINTTIPSSLHKAALMKDIKWSEALRVGIKILAGIDDDEERIKEDIQKKKHELLYLSEQLENIQKEKQEKMEAERDKYSDDPREIFNK